MTTSISSEAQKLWIDIWGKWSIEYVIKNLNNKNHETFLNSTRLSWTGVKKITKTLKTRNRSSTQTNKGTVIKLDGNM